MGSSRSSSNLSRAGIALVARVLGDELHGPGAVEGHQGDEVVQARWAGSRAAPRACRSTRTGTRPPSRPWPACGRWPASSRGMVSMSKSGCPSARMILTALSMTSRLRRPRKSILSRPSFSTSVMETWVTTSASPFCMRGRWSVSGPLEMTTPAAWMESWRMRPSSGRAMSTTSRTCVLGVVGACAARTWGRPGRSSRVMLSTSGTSLAMRSAWP